MNVYIPPIPDKNPMSNCDAVAATTGAKERIFPYSKCPFPSTLDLISSQYPEYWTKLVDLTSQLSPAVQEYNQKNPTKQIRLLGKAEFLNPGMSHKDRIAKRILESAVANKHLDPSKMIVAASSGNTGASLAMVGRLMGYQVVIITDSKCSSEKKQAIRAYGAELWVLSKGFEKDIQKLQVDESNVRSVKMRQQLFERVVDEQQKDPAYKVNYMKIEDYVAEMEPSSYFAANQYNNPDNVSAHVESTGQEIISQTGNRITHFVMPASTGGTVMGVGRTLKNANASVKIVLADPRFSKLFLYWQNSKIPDFDLASEIRSLEKEFSDRKSSIDCESKGFERVEVMVEGAGKSSPTGLMRIGESVLPLVDDVIQVEDIDAITQCRRLADHTGYLTGGSSGLNIAACVKLGDSLLAQRQGSEVGEEIIVTLLCDHGIKYLSKVYNDEWLLANFHKDEISSNKWLASKMGITQIV